MKLAQRLSKDPRYTRTNETRKQAVMEFIYGNSMKKEICARYGISYTTFDKWINKFGAELIEGNTTFEQQNIAKTGEMEKSPKELEKRIKELEKQLEMAKLKSELLEVMIDIAEEELKIPIRKKYGPQQSGAKQKEKRQK